ncbi:MAG: 1,4-dihydroxy-2-naphthoate polyprenyltransferase [Propionibacteriaceae bacterium]|jgi:1,4-dihydroxy-2-naphthoate octaprenyltransferase|nr:1,4-dihydroxy-2-naphthoate polyprenyltransferase [Propionibacteriaceae bacterium]
MASAREWLEGARVRTLPASVAPVIAGSGVAWFASKVSAPTLFTTGRLSLTDWLLPLLCLVVGVYVQVGSNFANDYSDGIRGTDDVRVGPQRLVGSRAATPRQVKIAAFVCFAISCLAGLGIVVVTGQWELIIVGAACVAAAWFYTGGRHPYGYAGLGEVFVFIFFGLVATLGTVYVQTRYVCPDCTAEGCPACFQDMPWVTGILVAAVMGSLSVAILVANNLRDIDTDKQAGKHTLPTRLGDRGTRVFYVSLVALSVVGVVAVGGLVSWWALLGLAGLVLLIEPIRLVVRGAKGRDLIVVLKATGVAELVTAVGLLTGFAIGWFHG